MKPMVAAGLLCGLLVAQYAHAEKQGPQRSRWVIIATIIDRDTGEQLREVKLGGPELEFDDPVKCRAIIDRAHPAPTDRTAAVLTCRQVGSDTPAAPVATLRQTGWLSAVRSRQ
jgi:hypothetical protein